MWICFLHSILSKVMLSVTSLIDMSFFITSTNVIFELCLPFFFHSLDLDQLTISQAIKMWAKIYAELTNMLIQILPIMCQPPTTIN